MSNPFEKCHSIQKDDIDKILNFGPILNDTSQVSKMCDEFAVGLFNLDNSFKLLSKSTIENFFYIFITGSWVELLLNISISPLTRIYLINILLHLYIEIYKKLKSNNLLNNVSFKKSSKN